VEFIFFIIEIHPDYHPMGTGFYYPADKAARAWNWPLASIYYRGQECLEL